MDGTDGIRSGQPRGGISWTAQPLPSGSLKNTKSPQGSCDVADLDTPPGQLVLGRLDVVTTICRPCTEPGVAPPSPAPIEIEQADPAA